MNHNTIRDMIMNDAFELYGQPKWTFGKNTCNTYEVFVEKLRLDNGDVVPAWPVMELIEHDETLTHFFSNWFLRAAIRTAMELSARTGCNLTLSVNLLPLYANREEFVEQVLDLIQEAGMNPRKLQFELSEAQRLTERGVENLNRLHDGHGVGLLLANFGTGFANVDLLRDVHFNGLELDRSFAALVPEHEQSCRVVVGIMHLAHTLDLAVCAKGIETQEQFEFFESLDCLKGQGYLIGKPMDMTEMEAYVKKYAKHR